LAQLSKQGLLLCQRQAPVWRALLAQGPRLLAPAQRAQPQHSWAFCRASLDLNPGQPLLLQAPLQPHPLPSWLHVRDAAAEEAAVPAENTA
jgi:hypothetical protein